MTDEQLARLFHETYERLAPDHGYETRKDSAVPWENVPERNRGLMIAVAGEVIRHLAGETRTLLLEAASAIEFGDSDQWASGVDDLLTRIRAALGEGDHLALVAAVEDLDTVLERESEFVAQLDRMEVERDAALARAERALTDAERARDIAIGSETALAHEVERLQARVDELEEYPNGHPDSREDQLDALIAQRDEARDEVTCLHALLAEPSEEEMDRLLTAWWAALPRAGSPPSVGIRAVLAHLRARAGLPSNAGGGFPLLGGEATSGALQPAASKLRTHQHVTPYCDEPTDHDEGGCACLPLVDEMSAMVFHRPIPRIGETVEEAVLGVPDAE